MAPQVSNGLGNFSNSNQLTIFLAGDVMLGKITHHKCMHVWCKGFLKIHFNLSSHLRLLETIGGWKGI